MVSSSQAWQKDAVLDESTRRLVATEENQEHLIFLKLHKERGDSSVHFCTDCVPHMEKVFSIVRPRYGLSPRDKVENLDVHAVMWCIFMSVTLQAAVYLGQTLWRICVLPGRQLFQVTRKLIIDQI